MLDGSSEWDLRVVLHLHVSGATLRSAEGKIGHHLDAQHHAAHAQTVVVHVLAALDGELVRVVLDDFALVDELKVPQVQQRQCKGETLSH